MYNSYNHFSLFIQARQKVPTLHGGGQTNGGWTTSTSLQTEAKKRSEWRFQWQNTNNILYRLNIDLTVWFFWQWVGADGSQHEEAISLSFCRLFVKYILRKIWCGYSSMYIYIKLWWYTLQFFLFDSIRHIKTIT